LHCKQQFIVLSAVEGLVKGCGGGEWQGGSGDFGGHVGLLAEVGQIGGEAV
jgi:hypothetical protein